MKEEKLASPPCRDVGEPTSGRDRRRLGCTPLVLEPAISCKQHAIRIAWWLDSRLGTASIGSQQLAALASAAQWTAESFHRPTRNRRASWQHATFNALANTFGLSGEGEKTSSR
jgi:hypothetical protein